MLSNLNNLPQIFESISPLAYLVVFFAGLATSLTPCVYPIIPITLIYIGARKTKNKLSSFLLSLFYVLGVACTYSFLGAIASLSGKLFGTISTLPITYIIVGLIFILFGLSMFELFAFQTKSFIAMEKLAKNSSNFTGSFILGLASGFIISPCTTPTLGVLLTYVASKQNLFFGISLLFIFAFGMGFTIMMLAAFANILINFSKIGKYSNIINKILGLIMFIFGIFYITYGIWRMNT